MPGDFSNYLLVTDLDGTLVDDQASILPKDLAAIEEFVQGGGLFAVSTGRAVVAARQYIEMLPVNAPCIFFNGGVVMNPATGEYALRTYLPETAREHLSRLLERFPRLHAAVLQDDGYHHVTAHRPGKGPFDYDRAPVIADSLDTLPFPWYKALFNIMDYPVEELDSYAQGLELPGVRFMPSTGFYYEMLPAGISKASGVRAMVDALGPTGRVLVAVGDYYNDLEMIEMADLGVTVANAPDDLKARADLVVCGVREGALCQLIGYLASHPVKKPRG